MSNTPTYGKYALDVDETGDIMSGSPCYADSFYAFNSAATTLWLKFYDKATAAASTDTPFWVCGIPPSNNGATVSKLGIRCINGLSIRCVTGVADNNNTGAGANEMVVSVGLG